MVVKNIYTNECLVWSIITIKNPSSDATYKVNKNAQNKQIFIVKSATPLIHGSNVTMAFTVYYFSACIMIFNIRRNAFICFPRVGLWKIAVLNN
jgi:small neutral amino acid transporter SnatA (MarC family)